MSNRSKLLFLAHLLPFPLHGGGQIKSYGVLRDLAERYDITLLAFIRSDAERAYAASLRQFCTGGIRLIVLRRGRLYDFSALSRALAADRSFLIERDDNQAMRNTVREMLSANRYTTLWVDHLQMAQFVPDTANDTCIVLDMHNAEYHLYKRIAELPSTRLPGYAGTQMFRYLNTQAAARLFWNGELRRLCRFETEACRRADRICCVSQTDANALIELDESFASKITVTPIRIDSDGFPVVARKSGTKNLLFLGTLDWLPNTDGLFWFCDTVLPLLRIQIPDITVTIVGARADKRIEGLKTIPNIRFVGFADDISSHVADSAALIVPIRVGGGVRVKILVAQAMGLPIVTTSTGAEGIIDHRNITVAEAIPTDFAAACLSMIQNEWQ